MATISKKDKLIEEAQKFVIKGQFDRAAKQYEQILALEPAAINLRQKLAELLFKSGRTEDARIELDTIGRHFSKNGFYLKAIAVYKQMQKIAPADISISLTLAELNEKHGLIANSLSEYKLVYEHYLREGNTSEALTILDRMQNVDPQNIPIKVKLAEAYIQQGKQEEAYSVFTNVASLLLERGDNTSLSRISARIQSLFPHKAEFMLEILNTMVEQGNAATALDSIQNLLRSNPNNKRTWDLITRAFQRLEQPQRLKIAYQHYLKFFPAEPDAIIGLMTFAAEERNLAEALELLDMYEQALITAGLHAPLGTVYHALEKIDPINTRIIEGLIRIAVSSDNQAEAAALFSKLKSLHSVSGGSPAEEAQELPPFDFSTEASSEAPSFGDSPFNAEEANSLAPLPDYGDLPEEIQLETLSATDTFASAFDEETGSEEEIEIDIDMDYDSPFADEESTSREEHPSGSNLDLFDTISTNPSGIRFGNEMENSDAQSHFDLGQAFREMGLLDEAIIEFRQAAQDPGRRIECLVMQCACLRERGEVEKAITMLQSLLKPGLSDDESCSVKYELATGYQMTGRMEEATALLGEINATNPAFRDINSRLNAAHLSDSLDFSDDDLLNF